MTRYVKGVPFDIERCTKAVPFLPKKGVGPRDGASPHKTLLNHSWGGGGHPPSPIDFTERFSIGRK